MLAIAHGLGGRGADGAHRMAKSMRLAMLFGALIAISIALNALIILAGR